MIPYARQSITRADIRAINKVLKSDFLTQGPKILEFENQVVKYCEVEFATAVNSATSALHLSCLALGLERGDYVWTSPISFVASANAALYCGANVDFIDIDHRTYNISIEKLTKKLIEAKKNNKLPKIIIVVHFAGQSCEIDKIYSLSKQYKFHIIEDASHAIGGRYKNRPIGNCEFSDITVLSFHPVKIITTGEGGMILTNNKSIYDVVSILRTHGITKDKKYFIYQDSTEIWNYQQTHLGFNYRMTDFQAALGTSQLRRIDKSINQRHQIAKKYFNYLQDLSIIHPWQHPDSYSSFHLYPIRIREQNKINIRNHLYDELRREGILVNLHYIPIYRHPYYEKFGFKRLDFPECELYFQEVLSLPMFPSLKNKEIKKITDSIKKILNTYD